VAGDTTSGTFNRLDQKQEAGAYRTCLDVLVCCGFDLRSDHLSARKCDPACSRLTDRTAIPYSLNHLASSAYEGIKSLAVEHVQIASNFFNAGHDFHTASSLGTTQDSGMQELLHLAVPLQR
jgi:hypothetical protein